MRVWKRAAAVFAAIAGVASLALGQQSSAKDGKTACTSQTRITRTDARPEQAANILAGNVLDPNGAGVPQASITLTSDATKETKTITTNEAGRFEFASLTPGSYSLKIEAIGFQTSELLNVSVEKNQIVNLETIVEITGQFLSGITSVSYPPVDTRTPGTTIISGDLIRKLPIQK
jgi:hypothetical protein